MATLSDLYRENYKLLNGTATFRSRSFQRAHQDVAGLRKVANRQQRIEAQELESESCYVGVQQKRGSKGRILRILDE